MARYVAKRLLWMIPITLGVAVLVFTLMTFCPGDPAEIILRSTATEENLESLRQELGLNTQNLSDVSEDSSIQLFDHCSFLNDMPLAFCIIELVFDAEGHGVDFVFRYCNDEMAVVEGIPVSEMLNRSFYEVFENGDKKWLVTYADVALNGNKHILHDYSPEIDKTLTIYCFQPAPGYCACVLIPS